MGLYQIVERPVPPRTDPQVAIEEESEPHKYGRHTPHR